jgi:hypothetical protein
MSAMADESGMVALVPDEASRAALALSSDDAEPPGDLHLTLTYLGDDAASMPPERRLAVLAAAKTAADLVAPVTGRIFAHATFNPDGPADRQPCAVYLVGEAPLLDQLRTMFTDYADGEQFAPYIPHVTAGYDHAAADLSYTGPVAFDALRVAIGETSTDIALTGTPPAAQGEEQTVESEIEVKRAVSTDKRRELAKRGMAMPDESYPMETIGDLANAIKAYGRCPEEKRPALRKLIVRNARRLKAMNMVPKDWPETKSLDPSTADDFTAGVLLGLAGLLEADILELKAGPPGATYPSPDPGAAKLRAYWTRGEGAAKIRWGAPGDFKRCVKHMRKFVGVRAEGLCNIYHRSALGVAPGKEHKHGPLWVPDTEAPGGWRADYPAWQLDLPDEAPEVKARTNYADLDDDEVLRRLDGYAAMSDAVEPVAGQDGADDDEEDPEEIYADSVDTDIDWQLQPDGTLLDPAGESDEDEEDLDDDSPASLFDWMRDKRGAGA